MEDSADKKTATSLTHYHDRELNSLFDAILNAKLPAQNYSMGQMRAFNDFKGIIKKNRAKLGKFTEC